MIPFPDRLVIISTTQMTYRMLVRINLRLRFQFILLGIRVDHGFRNDLQSIYNRQEIKQSLKKCFEERPRERGPRRSANIRGRRAGGAAWGRGRDHLKHHSRLTKDRYGSPPEHGQVRLHVTLRPLLLLEQMLALRRDDDLIST